MKNPLSGRVGILKSTLYRAKMLAESRTFTKTTDECEISQKQIVRKRRLG
ncbi:hypothetical protein SAMD00020551_2658 [Mesobacillus selenatarsenatis SF-1]|uniref:Uncharacterized protein n=1 Tax=Mesobacillus selenatarsenatis (strain DSM 18680 / JCM 14380 / FERM P-15431 / SF-1) TaxID=1321606 RepID=A0A0A8X644_MESS1|nr:hypothetical protein SAMD00020551_2658 [Mesobacillus selenatarsenatis SF-1]